MLGVGVGLLVASSEVEDAGGSTSEQSKFDFEIVRRVRLREIFVPKQMMWDVHDCLVAEASECAHRHGRKSPEALHCWPS
jgi:hypothetical protein